MSISAKVALKGSDRSPLPGARPIGPTDPHQLLEVSVILCHRQQLAEAQTNGRHVTHDEFARQYGANPDHVEMVRRFATDNHLQMLERGDEILRRTVTLAGTATNMEKAFGVELVDYEHPDGNYRGRTGPILIPTELANIIQGVLGLDDRQVAKPHFRYRLNNQPFGARASNIAYTPPQVANLYNFPQDVNGAGQTIALIELGGGYRSADIQEYFQSLGLPTPQVQTCSVNQAKNRPSTPDSADGEVMLDIEVAGAVAPGATIVAYFCPNTSRGFQDALSMAVHDQLRKPSIISISWGSSESNWTQQSMRNFDQVAQEAGLLGITIAVAAGDSGSSDGMTDGQNHVDFPASSPHVIAAGGTRLLSANGALTNETVWNDGPQGGATGGGYSAVFTRPMWQDKSVSQATRGVPDVAGDADPETGYRIQVDGQQMVVGGTSAVAPLWAGLVALLNQKLNTRIGFLNPTLYQMDKSTCFRDISAGNNGAYSAGAGWDPTTGLGSPLGTQIIEAVGQTTGRQTTNAQTRLQTTGAR